MTTSSPSQSISVSESLSSLSSRIHSSKAQAEVSLNKAQDQLYVARPFLPTNCLNHMVSNHASLKAAHAAFVLDYEKRKSLRRQKREVCFESDYGYDEDLVEPEPKRRRFQRRNSKTPQMLMAMSPSLLSLDFLDKDKNEGQMKTISEIPLSFSDDEDDDAWDGGLEIAEELVKHLQKRRDSQIA
ncbi:predicted protein [Phaeodactylum tricornutum CCAP 1055/1]|jgi:hypothetical protein|uniref:Uncharacterized protein n=1 Tax=Phaeodactylum tricornutum (strain CCAP 1055/1) TaxID=556484 RepID=B7FWF1_PHATC|nr:predicted protein [Phaeodactylum tricornutum CCAP 1055/1]EEC48968.1 predicted protein [Phaeodactylum tricornutum CCAP 1055/1]|eukprot:XP_002179145.1 predicted protein [Phaeodactylum tricornutum CCAP 1055/1]